MTNPHLSICINFENRKVFLSLQKNSETDILRTLKMNTEICRLNFENQIYLNFAEKPEYKQFFSPSVNVYNFCNTL